MIKTLIPLLLSFAAVYADVPTGPPGTQIEQPAPLPPAAPATPGAVPPPCTPAISYEASVMKMILVLVGLVVLALFTYWLLRKVSQGRFRTLGRKPVIQVVERKQLSPKTMLYIVELEGKKVLLSESQLEVRNLTTFETLSKE
jgi:flagellar biogenesis protein FliO